VNWDGVENRRAGRYLNRDSNFVLLRDSQSMGLSGKVDEEVGLMLGIIVSLWKMIHAANEKWCL